MRQVIVSVLLLWPSAVAAQPAPGNLPPDFYPQPNCEKPQSPGKPPEAQNAAAMQSYNARVKNFNQQAEMFNVCMKDYSDKAQNDINRILATVHTAVAAANQP
jgi:hypothetical protein